MKYRPEVHRTEELVKTRIKLGYRGDALSDGEFDTIISKANNLYYMQLKPAAWKCLFATLRIFGKRVSEVVELKTYNFRVRGELLYVTFKIRKKRGHVPEKTKPVSVHDIYVRNYILPYWSSVRDMQEFMFPRSACSSGHIPRQYVNTALNMLELEAPVWPHLFRGNLATEYAQTEGVSAYELQSWFDWSSLKLADSYLSKEGANLVKLAKKVENK